MKMTPPPPNRQCKPYRKPAVSSVKTILAMFVFSFLARTGMAQCDKLPVYAALNGCTAVFSTDPGIPGPVNWNFGDGSTGTGNPVTHIYTANATYTVTASYTWSGGTYTCSVPVAVTGCQMACCDADFTASVYRDCGALMLSLTSECSDGDHDWTVATVPAAQCMTLIGFDPAMASQTVQVTNINTCTVTRLDITHTVTNCAGAPHSSNQVILINEDAIFIGRLGGTTNLQDYNCVLPGASYSGACPVFLTGVVNTDKDFTFSGTDIHMHPGVTGLDVPAGRTLRFEQNAYVHGAGGGNCNCLWRGIYANGGTLQFDATSTYSATVEDALYAVRVYENSTLLMKRAILNKNFVGIRSSDGGFDLLGFERNEIDGTGPLRNICGLNALNDLVVSSYLDSGIPGMPVPYSNERGYAGWFVKDLTVLNLLDLSFYRQNVFRHLAKGMEVYDTDFQMRRNSLFQSISPGPNYAAVGTGGIFFGDTDVDGNNTFSFTGNGSGSALPVSDFDHCAIGIHLGTAVLNTRVNITGSSIINAQTGIHIDQRDGTVIGHSNGISGAPFSGIWDNKIRIEPAAFIELFGSDGIFIRDHNAGLSNLEIAENDIRVNFYQSLPNTNNGVSTGITATGTVGGGIPFASFQLDIHRNRIEMPLGRFGIRLGMYPAAFIHDNGPSGSATAGIFVNWNTTIGAEYSRGIFLTGIRTVDNLITCNKINSTAQGASGLSVWSAPDNVYTRNHLEGPSTGAEFQGLCGTATRFRCNLMEDNIGNGLAYRNLAQTGPQAAPANPPNPAVTSGNEWIGTFAPNETAFADGSITLINSRYFVRPGVAAENPLPNVTPLGGWFFAIVPNGNSADCLHNCPVASPQRPPLKELSSLDFLIATDSAQYEHYPEAQRWWNERHLYEKLYYSPALTNDNPLMQAFFSAKTETPMAELVRLGGRIDSLYLIDNDQYNLLESNDQALSNWLAELALVDSLLADSLTQTQPLSNLLTQRAGLLDQINTVQAENATINLAADEQRLDGVAPMLAILAAIAPDNVYEANEKEVLRIYLETVVASAAPDSSDLAELFALSNECLYEGGPAVDMARHLYAGFTGWEIPPADCPITGQRASKPGAHPVTQFDILVYPNPAGDYLRVQLPAVPTGEDQYRLILENSLGQSVLQTRLGSVDNLVSVARLSPGSYRAMVQRNGTTAFVQLLSIHR